MVKDELKFLGYIQRRLDKMDAQSRSRVSGYLKDILTTYGLGSNGAATIVSEPAAANGGNYSNRVTLD